MCVGGRARSPRRDDVVAPGLRDLGGRVQRVAADLGEQVRPGPRHAAHQPVAAAAEGDPAAVAELVGEVVHRPVAGALAVDGEREVGERVLVVGVAAALGDQDLRLRTPAARWGRRR